MRVYGGELTDFQFATILGEYFETLLFGQLITLHKRSLWAGLVFCRLLHLPLRCYTMGFREDFNSNDISLDCSIHILTADEEHRFVEGGYRDAPLAQVSYIIRHMEARDKPRDNCTDSH